MWLLRGHNLDSLFGGQEVGVLLVGSFAERAVLPQIGRQVGVGLGDGRIGGLGEVTQSAGGTTGRRVAILDTGHHQELLGNGGRDDASTTGSRNQTHRHGTALAGNLKKINTKYISDESNIVGNKQTTLKFVSDAFGPSLETSGGNHKRKLSF